MNRLTIISLLPLLLFGISCEALQEEYVPAERDSVITFNISRNLYFTKTNLPDEFAVRNVNLFIFNDDGSLDEKVYLEGKDTYRTGLLSGKTYSIYACANMGRKDNVKTIQDILEMKHYIAYPDDYSGGLPMYAVIEKYNPTDGDEVEIALERLFAKVTLRMDRSGLDEGTDIFISSVKVGGCMKKNLVFGTNEAVSEDDFLHPGFILSDLEVACLNEKKSGSICLYCLENLAVEKDLATYVEIETDYNSTKYYSEKGKHLKYRFHPCASGVERNTDYVICVRTEGDGLYGDSWRVDKDALVERDAESWSVFHPSSSYLECERGDTVHLWCEWGPRSACLEIDKELLDEDTSNGIYDYTLDEDGKGITLYFKKKGTGAVIFDIGPPVDEGKLYIIVCEP